MRTKDDAKLDHSINEVCSEQTGNADSFAFARSRKQEDGVHYRIVALFNMWTQPVDEVGSCAERSVG